MKQLTYICLLLTLFSSCKKEIHSFNSSGYLDNAKEALKDSLAANDYAQLEFSKAVLSKVDSVNLYYLRIPFKGKALRNDFVIVKTNNNGIVEQGKIIHMEGEQIDHGEGIIKAKRFNGAITLSSLDRKYVLNSDITDGYIMAFHTELNSTMLRTSVYAEDVLPEVVVVAYVNRNDDMDGSGWMLLSSLFYNYGAGGGEMYGGYYSSMDGGSYSYSGGGGGGGSYGSSTDDYYDDVTNDPPILVDYDSYSRKEAIDIEQYLKCFDQISDAGAKCEIGIYADIPVDSDPNKVFDFSSGSPGHTFIQIRKTSASGDQIISQNLGFYPRTGWKNMITNAPMTAKFVDDGNHEFNASYSKSLSPEEFKSVLTEIRYLKNAQYDIDNYNCTDWALNVFNKQGYGLDIPLYDIPGNYPSAGTSMPQGIYNKLLEMKQNNDVHADKISIGIVKGWVAGSNGPCN